MTPENALELIAFGFSCFAVGFACATYICIIVLRRK